MKRILFFAIAVFLSASVFALDSYDYSLNFEAEDEFSNEFWITNRNIGHGVPIIIPKSGSGNGGVIDIGLGWAHTELSPNHPKSKVKTIGASWSYKEQHIYWPNGFVFQFEASQGVSLNQRLYYEDLFQIGFGYAFASDKKAVITLAAVIGSYDSIFVGRDSNSVDSAFTSSFIMGLDFSATIRLSENLGFFVSLLADTPLVGVLYGAEVVKVNEMVIMGAGATLLKPGDFFYIKPSLGLSLTFGD